MKILLAINTTNPTELIDNALRWAGRCGFDVRVFIGNKRSKKYFEIVPEVNYQWYLALDQDVIVSNYMPHEYAKTMGYDLIVTIPENLRSWTKRSFLKDHEIAQVYGQIGKARAQFQANYRKKIKRWRNGVVMERIK